MTINSNNALVPNLCHTSAVLTTVVLTLLLSVIYVVMSGFDWIRLGVISLEVLWINLLSQTLLCYFRPHSQTLSIFMATLINLMFILTAASAIILLGQWMVDGFSLTMLLQKLFVTLVLAGLVLRYFYVQQQLIIKQQSELNSKLQALHSRIRPHFLFNTLNSVASLIAIDQEKAESAIEDLADLFRANLSNVSQWQSIKEDLILCEKYLNIEKLRFAHRLTWHIDCDENALPYIVPTFVLQPLLENAVVHGIQPNIEPGHIEISIKKKKNVILFSIRNPVIKENNNHDGNQMAITNIKNRLDLLFDDQFKFKQYQQDQQFVTELSIRNLLKDEE